MPKHDLISPSSNGWSQRSFCSSDPYMHSTSVIATGKRHNKKKKNPHNNSKHPSKPISIVTVKAFEADFTHVASVRSIAIEQQRSKQALPHFFSHGRILQVGEPRAVLTQRISMRRQEQVPQPCFLCFITQLQQLLRVLLPALRVFVLVMQDFFFQGKHLWDGK